jgi:predicted transcriptional regulator
LDQGVDPMTKQTKPNKTEHKRSRSAAKELRDQQIVAKAMAGATTGEIAKDLGVGRTTVSQVLNSDDVKKKIKEIDNRLASGIDKAVDNVLKALENGDANMSVLLLKNFGSMRTNVDINHKFPRPVVIKRSDGSEVVLGSTEDEGEEE